MEDIGFGNTSPCTRADVYFGLAQRGVNTRALLPPGVVATFRPALYTHRRRLAYVAYKKPDYAHALSRSDTDLLMLLFETYGAAGASRWCGSSDGCRTRCGTS